MHQRIRLRNFPTGRVDFAFVPVLHHEKRNSLSDPTHVLGSAGSLISRATPPHPTPPHPTLVMHPSPPPLHPISSESVQLSLIGPSLTLSTYPLSTPLSTAARICFQITPPAHLRQGPSHRPCILVMGLTPTASVELLAHLRRDGEARGHVQSPLGHLTQVSSLAAQLQGRKGGREGLEEGKVSCKRKGKRDIIVGFTSGEGISGGSDPEGGRGEGGDSG